MNLLRILLAGLLATVFSGCSQQASNSAAEAAAREELARRNIPVTLAGLKQATTGRNHDGAYLFEDAGFFAEISDASFRDALKHASASGNYGLYVMLSRYEADQVFPADELASSLNRAIRKNTVPMAALLINHGAKPGNDSLFYAAYQDNYDLAALLLANGGTFAASENSGALKMAARLGNLNTLQAFVDSGQAQQSQLNQAILYGALTEKIDVVKYLVDQGVDINQGDSDGCTALHYLSQDGTVDMVRYMVNNGALINATCRGAETPLKWAHYGDNTQVTEYLVSVGATQN